MSGEFDAVVPEIAGIDSDEAAEWIESLDDALLRHGPGVVAQLLGSLQQRAARHGAESGSLANTPYVNTIPADQQPEFPGDVGIEGRLSNMIRWNASLMVRRSG